MRLQGSLVLPLHRDLPITRHEYDNPRSMFLVLDRLNYWIDPMNITRCLRDVVIIYY